MRPPKRGQKQADNANSIVATVNDETISDFELRQRVALYLALNGISQQLTPEQRTRVRNQILEQLESEKLQLQEAQKKKITVSPLEVDKRINGMTQEYRFTVEQLRQNLKTAGASEDALRAQLTASIAWQKAVQDEYSDRVNITPDMINVEMARNAESANKPHYRVMEIFLPVDNPELDAKVKKDAEEVLNQLQQGAPFPVVARQFSQHPSAATGGDMGWINDGQLAPELNTALAKMEMGAISEPDSFHRRLLRPGPAGAPGAAGHQDRNRPYRSHRPGRHPAFGAPSVPGRSPRPQGADRTDHEGGGTDPDPLCRLRTAE